MRAVLLTAICLTASFPMNAQEVVLTNDAAVLRDSSALACFAHLLKEDLDSRQWSARHLSS
jgi:hypothetical protein